MHMQTLKRRWTVDDLEDLPDDDGFRYEVIDLADYFSNVLDS